jgi:hypothetical protein
MRILLWWTTAFDGSCPQEIVTTDERWRAEENATSYGAGIRSRILITQDIARV